MLRTLSIRNFAIIDTLDIEFGPGFNVLTGETGAGKSIVLDALGLLLGGRSGAEMVRSGANRASLDAVFDVSQSPELIRLADGMGFSLDDGELLLSREVQSGGKSTCRIAGRPATVTQLRELGEWLVDLHGQHEHQSLLAVSRHIDILDEWGGKDQQELRGEVGISYRRTQDLKREKSRLEQDARERTHLLDLYRFQVNEIAEARIQPDEDNDLETELKRVANARKLAEAASSAAAALADDESGGAIAGLSIAVRILEDVTEMDETLSPTLEIIRSALYELTEAERDLLRYSEGIEFQPERLQQIEDRLDILRTLRRKYGDTLEEVTEYGTETQRKLDDLSNAEERGADLDRQIAIAEKALLSKCKQLTKARKAVSDRFKGIVLKELRELAMAKADFGILLEPHEPGVKGADRVEFLIATNPGEPLRPLAKIASGGEISRVMLAIKSAIASQEALPTMVFDEIDVGVGGRTATALADKMCALSKSAQILCITHLPQIASRGDSHFSIEKAEDDRTARVAVKPLNAEERVDEIARMLGGSAITEAVILHAREMLNVE